MISISEAENPAPTATKITKNTETPTLSRMKEENKMTSKIKQKNIIQLYNNESKSNRKCCKQLYAT